MNIRTYAGADEAQLLSLWNTVFTYEGDYNQPDVALAAKLKVDDAIFVAEEDGRIAGTIMAGYDGHRGWLYSVAVLPALRGRGIGAELVRYAVDHLRATGCMKVNLQVRSDNKTVTRFYEGLGFCVEERISMGLKLPLLA